MNVRKLKIGSMQHDSRQGQSKAPSASTTRHEPPIGCTDSMQLATARSLASFSELAPAIHACVPRDEMAKALWFRASK